MARVRQPIDDEAAASLRVAIVDDDPGLRSRLRAQLEDCASVKLVGERRNDASANAAIERWQPHVIIVSLGRGDKCGSNFVRSIPKRRRPLVVCVGSAPHHAALAFGLGAVDYLSLPLEPGRVSRALDRVRERASAQSAARMARVARRASIGRPSRIAPHEPAKAKPKRLTVEENGRICFVNPADIVSAIAHGKNVLLRTTDHAYATRSTLQRVAQFLTDQAFMQIHRAILVRGDSIRAVRRLGGGTYEVTLADGSTHVSGRQYGRLLAEFIRGCRVLKQRRASRDARNGEPR